MTRLTSGSPCRGNRSRAAWSASAKDCSRGSSTRSQVGSLLMFSVSSWCQPPVRSWSSWQCLSSRCTGVPAKLSMMAGNWRKSPSSRNLIFRFMETQAMSFPQPGVELRDFLRHQPVDVAVPVPNGAPHPVVGRLRLHAEVLHGGVGLICTLYPSSRSAVTIWRAR